MKNLRCLAILLAAFGALYGQTPTGQITGLITDSSGAVVPEVRVAITNVATGVDRTAASGGQGFYTIPLLPPGKYQVAVQKEGFRPVTRSGITLNVSQTLRIDFVLQVGTVSESVSIAAEAPLIQTADTTVNSIIENKRIVDLPLNGRSAFSLAGLAPGVNPTGGGATPHISGSQTSTSEVQIDGAVDVSPGAIGGLNRRVYEPQVDAVEEFSVQVNGLAAEYGRFAGGVINVATKSGTNEIHGSAYDFLRNSTLDANNFFANRAGRPKSAFKRNQFGGTVGGPITIPGLYKGRDKTFFFAGFEKTIARSQAVFTTTVPTSEWKAGDFSNLRTAAGQPILIYDPLTGSEDPAAPTRFVRQPFQGNRVPTARFDPVSANMLKYFPSPNAAPTNPYTNGSNFVGNGVAPSENYRIDSRIDQNWSSKWRTFGRLSWGRANSEQFNPFGNIAMPGDGGGTTASSNLISTLDNMVTLGPNLLLNVRYSLGRTVSDRNPFGAGFDVTTLGLPASLQDAAARDQSLLPKFTFAGVVTDLGQAFTRAFEATMTHNVVANVTAIRARHTFKAGIDFRRGYISYSQFASPAGQFNFAQSWTQQEISTVSATAGSPLASFLLGLPNGGSASHAYPPALSSPYLGLFVQDDWKLLRRLTFNIGLRYEIQYPRTERYDRMSLYDMKAPSPIAGRVPASACLNCGNLLGRTKAEVNLRAFGGSGKAVYVAHDCTLLPRLNIPDRESFPVAISRSTDLGMTWDRHVMLTPPPPYTFLAGDGNHIVGLEDGTLIAALDTANHHVDPKQKGWIAQVFYRSRDGGKTWVDLSLVYDRAAEVGLLPMGGHHVMAAMRGVPNSELGGKTVQLADSMDGGRSWSQFRQLTWVFGQAHADIAHLPGGGVVAVYENRYPVDKPDIRARVSWDRGRTWEPELYILAQGVGYSGSVASADGTIITVTGDGMSEAGKPSGRGYTLQSIRWRPIARR